MSNVSNHDNPETRALRHAKAIADASGGKPTLRVIHPAGSIKNIGELPSVWAESTGVELEFVDVPGVDGLSTIELFNRVVEFAVENPDSFDVYSAMLKGMGDLVEGGVIQPVDEFVDAYEPELGLGPCQIPGAVRGYGDYRGKRYGLILEAPLLSLYYRRDLVDDPVEQEAFEGRFGYALSPPATWDELSDHVAFFHRPGRGFHGMTSVRGDWSYFWYLQRAHGYGGVYFDDNLRPAITQEAWVRALEDMARVASSHLSPGADEWDWLDWYHDFCDGNAYATFAWPSLAKYANDPAFSKIVGKVGYGLPAAEIEGQAVAPSLYCIGHMWVVSSQSSLPELAYLWGQWNTSPTITQQAIVGTAGTLNPSRACHHDDDAINDVYTPAYIDLSRECFRACVPELSIPGALRYLRALNAGINDFYAGKLPTAQVTLEQVAQEWESISGSLDTGTQVAAYDWLKRLYPDDYRQVVGWHNQNIVS